MRYGAHVLTELAKAEAPRGHISSMLRKCTVGKRVTSPDGANYKLYWLAE